MIRYRVLLLVILFSPNICFSNTSILDQVASSLRKICQAPAEKSEYIEVSGNVGLEGDIKVKLLGVIGGGGGLSFTKKEWTGVQNVLQEHQAGDNENYRTCTAKLTPLFLEKAFLQQVNEKDIQEIKNSVSTINQQLKNLSGAELVALVKKSHEPYQTIIEYLSSHSQPSIKHIEDAMYLAIILSERRSRFIYVPITGFLDSCQKHSVSETDLIELLRIADEFSNSGKSSISYQGSEQVHYCLKRPPSNYFATYLLTDKNGLFSPDVGNVDGAFKAFLMNCKSPITKLQSRDWFEGLADTVIASYMHHIGRLISLRSEQGSTCISSELALDLNQRRNRAGLLIKGYWLDSFHIFSNKCRPVVTMQEIGDSISRGVKIHTRNIEEATASGCIRSA